MDGSLGIGETNTGARVGDSESNPIAQNVTLPSPATDVACGYNYACALLNTKEVRCWGWNAYVEHFANGINGVTHGYPFTADKDR